jgi:prophage regulatory protein
MVLKIMRLAAVKNATGLGRTTIYNKIKEGKFPKPVQLGPKSVGWPENEIHAWQTALIEQRDSAHK